jgi:hypothetical protein
MLITVLLAESAQIGNTNAILPMTTVASAGAYLLSLSTPMELGPTLYYTDTLRITLVLAILCGIV